MKGRILFVAEAVTLAHVARPLALAETLDPALHEVVFASERRFGEPWQGRGFDYRPIRSITSESFLGALASGGPIYDRRTLEGYVAEDLALIDEVKPDVIVGDFRLSLCVSSRLSRIPYLAIANAYWSPFAEATFPMPELPMSRLLGVPLAAHLFRLARPAAFAFHARPLNRVLKAHRLASLGRDLRRVYTEADQTLYADVPELVPTRDLPPTHHYLGPIDWSPAVAPPSWWDDLPRGRPTIYATLGSSGRPGLLSKVFEALGDLDLTILAASAGKLIPGPIPSNVRMAPYLPGREVAARSSLVICNGGSPTTYQALGVGTPVVGLAENMDQHLNMNAVLARGAGILVRSENARPDTIRAAVERILTVPSFRKSATQLAETFKLYDPVARFKSILNQHL